jgi:hypothetical protein
MDLYRSYNNKLGHRNRGILLHIFRGIFSEFSEGGRPYRKMVQHPILDTFYEVQFAANPYSCTDCGRNFKTNFGGTNFVL